MAVSGIDINANLNNILASITGSKVDLSERLAIGSPIAATEKEIAENNSLVAKRAEITRLQAERDRQRAIGVRARIDKGLRAPFETRISGR